MVASFYAVLETAVSAERLAPFRPAHGDDLETAVNYFWNVALCQSLYSSLNMLEVATRNSLHNFLSKQAGKLDWYDVPGLLQGREINDVAAAKKKIRHARKIITPGRVVAALTLGFWVSLLDTLYGDDPTGPRLWGAFPSPGLARVFPHAPRSHQRYRRRLHARLDDMRLLRNRVSHYEPIWQGMTLPSRKPRIPPRVVSLHDLHAEVLETIGWLSPAMRSTMQSLDAFPTTEQKGHVLIERRLKRQFHLQQEALPLPTVGEGAL